METLVLVVHILVALIMIGLILVQQGKGAEQGASFGAGASATVFGAAGSANFLTKSTAALTTVFFITSIALAIFAKHNAKDLLALPVTSTPISAPATGSTTAPATTAPSTSPVVPAPASNLPVNPVN